MLGDRPKKAEVSPFLAAHHEQARRGTVVTACSDRGASLVHLMILEDVMNSLTAVAEISTSSSLGI